MTIGSPLFDEATRVLHALKDRHNVLIAGPPATGKSLLLAACQQLFLGSKGIAFDPKGAVAFPKDAKLDSKQPWFPAPDKDDRRVWTMTFHQGTRYRDFVAGISPNLGTGNPFRYSKGPLLEAVEHARSAKGAALLIIDEINRGPAVAVFGDAITSIESDKRLSSDGKITATTRPMRIMQADGSISDVALPHNLYILGAMNEADTSVETLDVAFRRRFVPFRLTPNEVVARDVLQAPKTAATLPEAPAAATNVYDALIRAWAKINDSVALGRGAEFTLGHGIFFEKGLPDPTADPERARAYAAAIWPRIYGHVKEVFFGDTRGLAEVLRADQPGNPYSLRESVFAESPVFQLVEPDRLDESNVYGLLRSIAEAG